MEIGILTIHNHYNYGAMLQAFATQTVLSEMGVASRFIDLYPRDTEKINNRAVLSLNPKKMMIFLLFKLSQKHRLKLKRFAEFRKLLNLTKRYYTKEELYHSPPEFDIYMVGSDQVWNMEKEFNSFNFFDFIGDECKKISYASSFGTKEVPVEYYQKMANYLSQFSAISVREDDAVEIIQKATGLNVAHVLDPTLLLKKDQWQKYLDNCGKLNYEYILIYGLVDNEDSVKLLNAVRKRYNMPVVGIPFGNRVPPKYKVDFEIKDAGPLEFVSLYNGAKVICTSSFHGLAFSVIFEKTFYVVPHKTRNSRLNSLLKLLRLEDRQSFRDVDILTLNEDELLMDYSMANELLGIERTFSINYIRNSIKV